MSRSPVCEHVFASIKGGPYARFRRALDTGNLTLVRAAAAELPVVNLHDALRICLLLRGAEPESFERAAVRWLGRFALERDATLHELRAAVAAFGRMRRDPHGATEDLKRFCR
jgi:hypothetical protein